MEPASVRSTDMPILRRPLPLGEPQGASVKAGGEAAGAPAAGAPRSPAADARLRGMVDAHYDFVWRSLRRLGVPETDVDDGAQQVFWVVARKLADIAPASERSFLFSTAMHVASDARRARTRRREVPDDDAYEPRDPGPDPEQVADRRRARAVLDEVLDAMSMDLRAPFVLFELEELPTAEIAAMLDLPTGTVASRLRRAREEFQAIVARRKARGDFDAARDRPAERGPADAVGSGGKR